ncbi:unnamed protein product, partial [Meganyctiphanes norvegica]
MSTLAQVCTTDEQSQIKLLKRHKENVSANLFSIMDVADTTLDNLPTSLPGIYPGTSQLPFIPEEIPLTTREPLTLRSTTIQAMGRPPADRLPTSETPSLWPSQTIYTVVDILDNAPEVRGVENMNYTGPNPPVGPSPQKPRLWSLIVLAITQIVIGCAILAIMEIKFRST